jgi:hypothetical protein
VSLFYTFYGEADIATESLVTLVAAVVTGSVAPDGTVFCEGMNVTPRHVSDGDDEDDSTGRYFGFVERVSVTFTFDNLAPEETTNHNMALMVQVVLAIFDASPGRGVLLFNGSKAILQRLDNGVEFASDWEDWWELVEVIPIAAQHSVGRLAQPLL